MTRPIDIKAKELPATSGVYLFRDRKGRVVYVGKALNLRARVRQYLTGQDERFMVPYLVRQAHDVEVIVVDSEKEALLLENTLIKKYRPRYNIQLRDDKSFLHLQIDPSRKWPRYTLVRRIRTGSTRTFGPYHSASAARETLAQLQRAFPLRTCTDSTLKSRSRPCLLHQMGRCVAPCVGLANPSEYAELVEESMLFLDGRNTTLIRRLTERMHHAAEAERFEEAARLRDRIRSMRQALERQKVVDTKLGDRDVWGLHRRGDRGALCIIPVREGLMGEPSIRLLKGLAGNDTEALSSLINTTYAAGTFIPPEILVAPLPRDTSALVEVLSERRGRRVVLKHPLRGSKARLLELAQKNARLRFDRGDSADARREEALEEIARLVGLDQPPHRMECFDNSNLQGEHPVAAMSVFLDGRPARAEYRRYRVKTVVGSDDYATMREILERRMRRALTEGNAPDLLVVDGGKGQLGVALAVLEDLGLSDQPVIGISKPRTEHAKGDRHAEDKLVLPHRKDPLRLPPGHPSLRMLQHLRDEVHRHAITYHRKVRRRDTLASALEGIPGVGASRRKALLRHLGSLAAVADASPEDLRTVPGIGPALADTIWSALRGGSELPPDG